MNKETVLSYFLGFVAGWFGVKEILDPAKWITFVPKFLGSGDMITTLIVIHGVLLVICALGLIFNFHRRVMAGILTLMLLDIVVSLVVGNGFSETVIRDIGLLGMAFALTLRS